MRKLLPCFLLVSVAALPVILKADDEVIESIVARVNNQIITHSEFLHSKEELKKEASAARSGQRGQVRHRSR